jgi:hypothetical protein
MRSAAPLLDKFFHSHQWKWKRRNPKPDDAADPKTVVDAVSRVTPLNDDALVSLTAALLYFT